MSLPFDKKFSKRNDVNCGGDLRERGQGSGRGKEVDAGDGGLWEQIKQILLWLGPGIFGRMIFHMRQVQSGRRRFFGPDLLIELPVAIGMGYLGHLAAQWTGMAEYESGIAGLAGYVGPRVVDRLVERAIGRFGVLNK